MQVLQSGHMLLLLPEMIEQEVTDDTSCCEPGNGFDRLPLLMESDNGS